MNQPNPKQKRILEVRASFEVSRLSPEYLASAYEQILPVVRRVASMPRQAYVIDNNAIEKRIGEENYEQP